MTENKSRLVLNEDTMTLVKLDGYCVINKQTAISEKSGRHSYRITVHYLGNEKAVLCEFSDEELADFCLTSLIHYVLTGKNVQNEEDGDSAMKDIFKVRSIIDESGIIIVNNKKKSKNPLSGV